MSVEFDTRNRNLVKWNVNLPRPGLNEVSNSFSLYDCEWHFCLFTDGNSRHTPFWIISYYHTDYGIHPPFPLILYVRYKERDYFLSTSAIIRNETEIFTSTYQDFIDLFPVKEVGVGTHLQFVFDFHLGILNPEPPIKVEKSVQTSDPNTENHLCLENLSLDLSKLIEGGTDTDVQLKCGDFSIGAHKMILGARSEVFRSMMQSDMVEGRDGVVEIIDMEPKILKIFIRYIYTGNLPELTVDTALPIYEAADKYQVGALKKRSSQFLMKNLSPENALAILVASDAHSDSVLKHQSVSYISEGKIPSREEEWLKFCNEYPKLANEVLNFMMHQVFHINS